MRAIFRLRFINKFGKMSQTPTVLRARNPVKLNNSDHKLNISSANISNKTVLMDVSQHSIHTSPGTHSSANMTTLVVGLGNHSMGGTRHSIGMAIADQICKHLESSWKKDSECKGMVAMATLDENHKLILLKPRMFMNENGRSVLKTVTKYKIPLGNIFLLHDDIDRPLGKYSIKEGGSAGGHNGVKSVINCLGTNTMLRLRFGVDRPTNPSVVADYVLEKFTAAEKELLPGLTDECIQLVLKRIKEQIVK